MTDRKKRVQIWVTVDEAQKARLGQMKETLDVPEAALIRLAIRFLVNYWTQHGVLPQIREAD